MAKIMLVEDDNNLREIYGARLLAEGYEIVSAKDGEEALALAVKEKPDLIISDIMMPKISGFDMLDILRSTAETKNTKVIMMTALSQAEDKERAGKLGADRYLVKSQVTLEDVAKAAAEVLAGQPEGGVITPTASVDTATAPAEPANDTTPAAPGVIAPTPVPADPAPAVVPVTPAAPAAPAPAVAPTPTPTPTPAPTAAPAAEPAPAPAATTPAAPAAPVIPDAATVANNLKVLADAVAAVGGAVTPAAAPAPAVAPTPTPTPTAAPAAEPAPAPAATTPAAPATPTPTTSVHTKVISPINDLNQAPPDLDKLLAAEEAKESTPAAPAATTPAAPATPTTSDDESPAPITISPDGKIS